MRNNNNNDNNGEYLQEEVEPPHHYPERVHEEDRQDTLPEALPWDDQTCLSLSSDQLVCRQQVL
jgi:hypothetical protein